MGRQILVVGSANMDYVVRMDRFPLCGETLLGEPLQLSPGGKGANQAVAAARLADGTDSRVAFIGKVGADEAGVSLTNSLKQAGVMLDGLRTVSDLPTGSAMIWRDAKGNNSIVVSPAANFSWSDEDIELLPGFVQEAGIVLLQMEIPLSVNQHVLNAAKMAQAFCILDPAPAQLLSMEFLQGVDLLTPNESEMCTLLGMQYQALEQERLPNIANALLDMGPRAVLLKLGERGAFYKDPHQEIFEPALKVIVKDTTAAGDVFNGALAVALSTGTPIREAMRFANSAAAISVTRVGAQRAVPLRFEVLDFQSTN